MRYRLTVNRFDSGLNELLSGVYYDYRNKRVVNSVKAKNDKICIDSIRLSRVFNGVKLQPPIVIHYKFYCKDKRRDRSNVQSAFIKSFEDALQKLKILSNDGYDDVVGMTTDFEIDRNRPRVDVCIEEVPKNYKMDEWSGWNED